jgi:TRAP-type mannitol/chloroaromatic compound transport system substrate-binding protein
MAAPRVTRSIWRRPIRPEPALRMSNREALVAVVVAFTCGLLAALALRPAATPVASGSDTAVAAVRWRVPIAFSTNLPGLGDNALHVSQRVLAVSGGRIRLEIFEPGELVPPFSIVDAVRDEKVQAGYTWLGYDQGKLAASVLFGAVPFGMEPWEYASWWYEGGGQVLAEDIYGAMGVHPIFCGLIGPETAGWFREPISDPSDLEGLKIRFAGLGGKAVQSLGASVTMLPGGEIFQALERGAIDATEFSLPIVDQRLGFDRVARFNYFPGWHQPFTAFHLTIGATAWNALDDTARAIVDASCTAGVIRNLAHAESLQGPVLRQFPERGVTARLLPASVLDALERASHEVIDAEAAADADFARVLESQRAFSADYDHWRRFAYIQRQTEPEP